MSAKICLTLLNGTGYVFDADDYMRLRKFHGIVGSLVGTTNERGCAVNECRLPAELTIYETRLLIEKGIAELTSKKEVVLKEPTAAELETYKEKLTKKFMEQAELAKAEKLKNAERNMEKILQGKRKKLEKAGELEKAQNLTADQVLLEISENFIFEPENALHEIHCAHPELHVGSIVSLREFTPFEELKYRVFCDFWQHGKYVTAGDTFGGDFLVYPGDPLIYHASHIIIVLKEPSRIGLLDLITKARLAIIVNKLCIFAYGTENDGIKYQTIEWDGNREQELPTTSRQASKMS